MQPPLIYRPARGKKAAPGLRLSSEASERFWQRVDKKQAAPCWIERSDKPPEDPPPKMKIDGEMVMMHRFAYELQNGPIPAGHTVYKCPKHHLCMRGSHLHAGPRNGYVRQPRPTTPPAKGRFASKHWRDVEGFPGYEVSDEGQVRSWWVHGRGHYAASPRVLRLTKNTKSGYLYAMLTLAGGRHVNALVHKLVARAFVGPCPPGKEVRHYPDNDRTNNKVSNLSYATHLENMRDKHEHGTVTRGDAHWARREPHKVKRGDEQWARKHPERVKRGGQAPRAKITPEMYDQVVAWLREGVPQSQIAARIGVSQERISAVATGKRTR